MNEEKCICKKIKLEGEIHQFNSATHYDRIEKHILDLIEDGELILLSYDRDYFWKRTMQCSKCQQIWILSEPDFPYTGFWGTDESYSKR